MSSGGWNKADDEGAEGPTYSSKEEALDKYEVLLTKQKRIKFELLYVKRALARYDETETAGTEEIFHESVSTRAPTKAYCIEHFGEEWWAEHSKQHVRRVLLTKQQKLNQQQQQQPDRDSSLE